MAWKPTGRPTVRQQREKWVVRVDGIDTETGKHRPRQLGTFASPEPRRRQPHRSPPMEVWAPTATRSVTSFSNGSLGESTCHRRLACSTSGLPRTSPPDSVQFGSTASTVTM